ncbi:hypothetical protein EVB87_147 [Rhizobium phage RHph_N28_1]|nr:hypothetical protein EVB87_147 [Rhizobium phage RHph_N28_1]QIG74176.1 hypothetical protein EVC07_148 [Rhizobium phage RHph_N42]QIG74782.1 hypothetical protein EVC12_147 [Rhizobium phage RHph_I42]QXV73834.1 hypothetical protein [Rhizobium phage RHph_N46]
MLELAKSPQKAEPQNDQPEAKLPDWWTKLDEQRQEYYLRLHPNSRMHKAASQALKDRLRTHPKERKALRERIAQLAKKPMKYLKKDLSKIKDAQENLSDKDKKEITDQVEEAIKTKKPRKILKAIMKGLVLAGVLTIGAGLIGSGGLPYVLLAGRAFQDGRHAFREIKQRLADGEHAASAVFSTIGNTITRAASDPKVIAAMVMLHMQKKKAKEEEQEREDKKAAQEEKRNAGKKKEREKPAVQANPGRNGQKRAEKPQPKEKDDGKSKGNK